MSLKHYIILSQAQRKQAILKMASFTVGVCGGLLFVLLPHVSLAALNGYAYERPIVINASKVSPNNGSSLANFPVFVSTTFSDLAASSSGGTIQKINASGTPLDIIFSPSEGCTSTSTGWEIERYNSSTGELDAWVNNGTLSSSAGQTFYICYDNPSATAAQGLTAATWDGSYKNVFHFKEGAGTTISNTISAGKNLTINFPSAVSWAPGELGEGLYFNGTTTPNQPVTAPEDSTIENQNFTLSFWLNPTSLIDQAIEYSNVGSRNKGWWFTSGFVGHGKATYDFITAAGADAYTNLPAAGAWMYVTTTVTPTSTTLYLNGISQLSTGGGVIPYIGANTAIGNSATFSLAEFNGNLDELRISNIARSADWITTEYNNQASSSGFLSVNAAQSSPGVPSPPPNFTATSTASTAILSWSAPYSSGSSSIIQYDIMQEAQGTSSFVQVATTSPGQTSITLTGFTSGRGFIFAVQAENSQGVSGLSFPASPAFLPGPPNNVTAISQPNYLVATVTTIAGVATTTCATLDGTGSAARICSPKQGYQDKQGNYYFSDHPGKGIPTSDHEFFRKMTPGGTVITEAGTSANGYVNGQATTTAEFSSVNGTVIDKAGNFYIADASSNCVIRKITPDGTVSTYAGTPGVCTDTDGTLATATFNQPDGLVFDAAGNLYVTDWGGCTIRKITLDGTVSTYAGVSNDCREADGTAGGTARLSKPAGIVLDSSGNMFTADEGVAIGCTIRKISPSGAVTTFAGTAGQCSWADGTGSAARFNIASFMSIDTSDNIYITDHNDNTIRRITPAAIVTTIAGLADSPGSSDGIGSLARVNNPDGIAIDSSGNIYISDQLNNAIRKAKVNQAATVKVSFTMDPTLEGGGVTGYTVTSNPPGGIDENAGSTATTHTIAGLTNDGSTTYTFTVTATNAVGISSPSSPSNSILPIITPDPPSNLSAQSADGSVSLSWTAPATNGSVVIDYLYEYKPTSTSTWASFPHLPSALTTVTIPGLTNNTSYDFRVSAINSIGTSTPSVVVSATPAAATFAPASGGTAYFVLAISKSGTGSGTVSGNGLNCGTNCSASFPNSQAITLIAAPDLNSAFVSWGGDCSTASGTTCILTIASPKNVTASFNLISSTTASPSNPALGVVPGSTPVLGQPITTPEGGLTARQPNALLLINDNGTFYLIQKAQRQGIANPGILSSYGFEFKDAVPATPDDLALPQGSLLLPNDGALVKSRQDPTIYLISNQHRYSFTSAKVFSALGFKFSSVLVVTDPELQALPLTFNLSNGNAAHLAGVNINDRGTVYWISPDNLRHAYTSLATYNSWNLDNDFSGVIPSNAADLDLPVGDDVAARVIR